MGHGVRKNMIAGSQCGQTALALGLYSPAVPTVLEMSLADSEKLYGASKDP